MVLKAGSNFHFPKFVGNTNIDTMSKEDKWKKELKHWDKDISLIPNDYYSYFHRGKVKARLGDYVGAKEDFNQASRSHGYELNKRIKEEKVIMDWLKSGIPYRIIMLGAEE